MGSPRRTTRRRLRRNIKTGRVVFLAGRGHECIGHGRGLCRRHFDLQVDVSQFGGLLGVERRGLSINV